MGSRGENLDITIIYLTIGFLLMAVFIIVFIAVYRRRLNNFIRDKIELKYRYDKTLLQSQLEIQEQTFKNISQEIHDNIGQALTLAKLNLNTMPDVNNRQQEKITTTKNIIGKAISDLRDLSRSLNTDYIADMGLQKALDYELGLISKSTAVNATVQTTGEAFRMEQQKELILFRIVQEALNNIVKHAGASSINILLAYTNNKLELSIADNGKGFEISAGQPDTLTGLGLRNMQNRAKLIGAVFNISSQPGSGTMVKIEVPKTKEENGTSFTAKTVF